MTFVEFELYSSRKTVVVNIDHIVYIERAEGSGTHIHLRDKHGITVTEDFDSMGEALVTGGYG